MNTAKLHPRAETLAGVWKWIQKRSNKHAVNIPGRVMDEDDLSQDVALAFLTRPTGFDPSRARATTYAKCLVNGIAHRRHHTAIRYSEQFGNPDPEKPLYIPVVDPDAGERDERAYLFALIGELIELLDSDERAVIDYRYLSFATVPHLTETGKALDLGKACNVRAIEARAIAKLREGVMASSDDFDDELCAAEDAAA